MSSTERNGKRRTRASATGKRIPELGYSFIVTDTKKTEESYMLGLRNSIPESLRGKLVIKVVKTATCNLVDEALNLASLNPQFGEIWIVFDRDQVKNFDDIINQAKAKGINVGWTNPCIEVWFDAYFGSMPNYLDSVACCSGFASTFERVTGHKYDKGDQQIYEKLNRYGNEEKAIDIADKKFKEHINNRHKASEMSPCTTVHMLVREIKSKVNNKN